MHKWIAMLGMDFGRCQDCLKPFFYTWCVCAENHFPITCIFCGKRAVLTIDEKGLLNDDKIIMYNEILR